MWKTRIWALLLLIIGAGIGYFIYASEPKLHEGKTVNGQAFAEKFPFRLGLDLSGGVQLVYQADVTSVKPGEVKNAMDSLRDVIERRVNTFGVSEPIVQIEEKGGIMVDEYMRTSVLDIFAIGDCAQTKDFITGKNIPIMLASVATSEARIAASNLYQIGLIRENKGTVGVFSTFVDGLTLAVAGLTEKRAQEEGFDYLIGEAEAPNRHPATLPGAKKIKVKLIFAKSSENLLLGGEIMGPESVGEMLNILAMAIQQKTSLFDFNTWQIATHPLLTAAPTVYPIIAAAQSAMLKIKKE